MPVVDGAAPAGTTEPDGVAGRSASRTPPAAAPRPEGAAPDGFGASIIDEGGYLPVRRAHAHTLLALQGLALRLQGGRHHHLGAVELGEILVTAGGHRGAQAAEQVEGPVVLPRRTDEDLLEGAVLGGRHARPAREARVERRHAPVEAPAGRLIRTCERRADHHGVGSQRNRLGDVPAVAHAAVGDHLAVLTGLEHVRRAGVGDVGYRSRLRDTDAQHAPGRAGRPGPDADEHAGGAGAHEVQARVVGGASTDDHGHVQRRYELLQVQWLRDSGHVLAGDDGSLDHEHVQPGLHRDLVIPEHALGRKGCRHHNLLFLDLADALGDQLGLDRLAIDLLHLTRRLLLRQRGDPFELLLGVLVAREDPLQVEHRQASEATDDGGGLRRYDAVHRRGQHRELELVGTELPRDVDVVRVPRAPRGNDRNVVEAVGSTPLLAASYLYLHL